MTREQVEQAMKLGYEQVCEHMPHLPCPATGKQTLCLTCSGPTARMLVRPVR